MSRIENVIQRSSRDRPIPRLLDHLSCGKCHGSISYDQGTEWNIVNQLVNEHWKACPGTPRAMLAHMAHTPTPPPDTEIALPARIALEQCSSSNTIVASVSSPNNSCFSSGCERKRRTLEQRKLELEQDEYAKNITKKSVVCGACHKEISLDKRSDYYPGLWLKHKRKCPIIEKLERAKAKPRKVPDGVRQVACNVVNPAFGDNSHGDTQHHSPAERYQNHGTAATHRIIRQCDSEDPTSEDEDEYGDLLPHAPFPTLNSAFYQSRVNHSQEWVYRYATKDEISTNLFEGQNEPYARPSGSPPCTHATLQTGSHCETPRCVIKGRVEHTVSQSNNFRSTREQVGEQVERRNPWESEEHLRGDRNVA